MSLVPSVKRPDIYPGRTPPAGDSHAASRKEGTAGFSAQRFVASTTKHSPARSVSPESTHSTPAIALRCFIFKSLFRGRIRRHGVLTPLRYSKMAAHVASQLSSPSASTIALSARRSHSPRHPGYFQVLQSAALFSARFHRAPAFPHSVLQAIFVRSQETLQAAAHGPAPPGSQCSV